MCRLLFPRPGGKGGCLKPASNGLEVSLVSPNLSNSFESEKSFLKGFGGGWFSSPLEMGVMICKALLVNIRSLLSSSLSNLVELITNFCCLPTSAFQQYIISEANCLRKCWHQSWCTPTFLGCVDFCRFYSCCYFHRCEMHSTKPRPQLLCRDAQGCTFCTELIGGLVVIPCTAILRIWTPFPALLFGLHCQFTPVGISFWRVGTAASGKLETSSLVTTKPTLPKFQLSHVP